MSPRRKARRISPQSNQRGIETVKSGRSWRLASAGLNRTSVGLKLKTQAARKDDYDAVGLNRTSVGLKLVHLRVMGAISGSPQSNQRGIETRQRRQGPRADAGLNRTSVGLKR